jgi:hypothetical protein
MRQNRFYGSGFGHMVKVGFVGAVGGLVNQLSGDLVDYANKKF